jgi:hypothetical protein
MSTQDEEMERLRAELAEAKVDLTTAQLQLADERAHSKRAYEALAAAEAERDALKAAILDIDAHATPFGDIPDDPGYVGTYLVTAGALHRALGKIGHTAPKCQAEAVVAGAKALAERWVGNQDAGTIGDSIRADAGRQLLAHLAALDAPGIPEEG